MNKKRIYEFAREIEKSSKEVVDTLVEMGEDISNHMSTINEDVQNKVIEKFDSKKAEEKETPTPKAEEPAKEKVTSKAEEPVKTAPVVDKTVVAPKETNENHIVYDKTKVS